MRVLAIAGLLIVAVGCNDKPGKKNKDDDKDKKESAAAVEKSADSSSHDVLAALMSEEMDSDASNERRNDMLDKLMDQFDDDQSGELSPRELDDLLLLVKGKLKPWKKKKKMWDHLKWGECHGGLDGPADDGWDEDEWEDDEDFDDEDWDDDREEDARRSCRDLDGDGRVSMDERREIMENPEEFFECVEERLDDWRDRWDDDDDEDERDDDDEDDDEGGEVIGDVDVADEDEDEE